jgi:hypothetical protein
VRAIGILSVIAIVAIVTFINLPDGFGLMQRFNALQHEAIQYYQTAPTDSISGIEALMATGELELQAGEDDGYLESLLDALDIGVSSQILVSSKTSLQLALISPDTPRAIYFNDDTYIGWVQGSPLIEVTTVDPNLGAVFYTLDQTAHDDIHFERDFDVCMQCHNPTAPGHVMTSTIPDATGQPLFHAGSFVTSDRSPLEERWGGWYVTGTHGNQLHMGNLILRDLPPSSPGINSKKVPVERERGANVTDLSSLFNADPYLTDTSDIVALMIMGHQVAVQNTMTKLNYAVRKSIHDSGLDKALDGHEKLAEQLVEEMLLVGEARLTSRMSGTSGFTEDFETRGPWDSKRRSLRELDLSRRLFRYPLSFLIYSKAFEALPDPAKHFVYNRIEEVLTGDDQSEQFDHLSRIDRQEIREILVDTKRDYLSVVR